MELIMDSAMEMQIYKEIVDKMRQLMALEGEDKEEMEMPESLEAVMGEEDKAESAESEALAETEENPLKEEMKAFFGGGKPLMPDKKGMKVGITEVAVMPSKGKKSKGY
jgi:hypothetical protein